MPEGQPRAGLADLNERSRDILRHIVDAYMESGEPVGSRTISRRLAMSLSPAPSATSWRTWRRPGCSTRRTPRPAACRPSAASACSSAASWSWRLSKEEREKIDGKCAAAGRSLADVLETHHHALGLSRCAGLVVARRRSAG